MAQPNPANQGGLAPQVILHQATEAGNLAGQDGNMPIDPIELQGLGAAGHGPNPLLNSLYGFAAVASSTTEEHVPPPLLGSLNGLPSVAQAPAEE
ncbi:hypothetical protein FRC07_014999 [Ceratobasidium sp. 392]|nr:hypothetical protein FRC07_014999 [Ceratobasidium sp. 392]